ncbi:MAG TPA: phosphoribosylanthranilate isomerase [Pirellulales bacterium]|jgi:phosphoribosylanthranilate isomerase|nr:phosphoribosylanthranilate isomerase [Pirellulales bacterium]
MFRVKICGITSPEDARLAADAGADAIGINFYEASPRACSPSAAKAIAEALPADICKVGVFVNASADEIRAVAEQVGLDLVQLHGDEPPEFLARLKPLPIMRAARITDDLSSVEAYLVECHRLLAVPRMLLVDRLHDNAFGGTGQQTDWCAIAAQRSKLQGMPLVLAGGLKPDNVASAIRKVRPWGVDSASGVEQSPGRKSPELVHAFVREAKAALDAVSRLSER